MVYNCFVFEEDGHMYRQSSIDNVPDEVRSVRISWVSGEEPATLETVTERAWPSGLSVTQEFVDEVNELCRREPIYFIRYQGSGKNPYFINPPYWMKWRRKTAEEMIHGLLGR